MYGQPHAALPARDCTKPQHRDVSTARHHRIVRHACTCVRLDTSCSRHFELAVAIADCCCTAWWITCVCSMLGRVLAAGALVGFGVWAYKQASTWLCDAADADCTFRCVYTFRFVSCCWRSQSQCQCQCQKQCRHQISAVIRRQKRCRCACGRRWRWLRGRSGCGCGWLWVERWHRTAALSDDRLDAAARTRFDRKSGICEYVLHM